MRKEDELPIGWIACNVGDVIQLHYGKALPEKIRDPDGVVPVFGSSGQVGFHSSALVQGPCIIVGRKGTAGAVEFSKDDCWPIDTTYFVRPPEQADIRFFFYLLKSLRLENLDRSTAIPGLNRDDAYSVAIWIPPLNEQRRIVEKIETLFARLDQGEAALRHTQRLLARYRQSVLKAAVTGALTADWRAQNAHRLEHGRDLLARILQTRRQTWQGRGKYQEPAAPDTTNLPELPEGWVWASSSVVCSSIADGTHDTPKYVTEGIPLVTSKNLLLDGVDFENTQKISRNDHLSISARSRVSNGDILFAMIGTIGNPVVVDTDREFSIKNVGLFRLNRSCILPDFMRHWLMSPTFVRWLEPKKRGTSQKFASLGLLRELPIPLPCLKEQQVLVDLLAEKIGAIDSLRVAIQLELTRSAALRQSILKDAFAGKLVPQDPTDEPAADLLARLRATRPTPARRVGKAQRAHAEQTHDR